MEVMTPNQETENANGDITINYQYTQKEVSTDTNKGVLLDTGSSFSVFKDAELLTDIKPSKIILRARTNGGIQESKMTGTLPGFFRVLYNPDSMLNILSLKDVRKKFRVTMDTKQGATISVHDNDGGTMMFKETHTGLYLLSDLPKYKDEVINYCCLNTVDNNEEGYTPRQLGRARLARELHTKTGCPRVQTFVQLLDNNYYRNFPLLGEDLKCAIQIYGPLVHNMKGKTTKTKTVPIVNEQVIDLPTTIRDRHPNIILSSDHMFIQNIPILTTICAPYGLRTVQEATSRIKEDMIKGLNCVKQIYQTRGLEVTWLNTDNEFECVREEMRPTRLNMVPASEDVSNIERSVRTIKDGTRSHVHRLPYTHYPKIMIMACAIHTVAQVNQLPSKVGVSTTMSPLTLITGTPRPDYHHVMDLNFGDYVQDTIPRSVTNTNEPRTVGSIALYSS